VTPFDPQALLVMLLTFYPIVSGEALLTARRERPEYFGGGTIIGHHFDALQLPDGRIFDCIFSVDSPAQHWQMIDETFGGDPVPPGFELAPGPLAPLDSEIWPEPVLAHTFEQLVAGHVESLGDAAGALHAAQNTIAAESSPAAFEAIFNDTIDPAASAIADGTYTLARADNADVIETTNGHGAAIDRNDANYNEPPPEEPPPIDAPEAINVNEIPG